MLRVRKTIARICPDCKKEENVRKDAAGYRCRSCQSRRNIRNKIGKYIDISNKRFGKLIALNVSHQVNKLYFWNCICDCGNKLITSGNRLRYGKTKSCGCIVKTQNGLSRSPSYRSWDAMIQRCYDKSVPHYERYGGRGISVCDRWKNSFLDFLKDMGDRPEGKTLDRIDNNGNYEPLNCKWSTIKEQSSNKRPRIVKNRYNYGREEKVY